MLYLTKLIEPFSVSGTCSAPPNAIRDASTSQQAKTAKVTGTPWQTSRNHENRTSTLDMPYMSPVSRPRPKTVENFMTRPNKARRLLAHERRTQDLPIYIFIYPHIHLSLSLYMYMYIYFSISMYISTIGKLTPCSCSNLRAHHKAAPCGDQKLQLRSQRTAVLQTILSETGCAMRMRHLGQVASACCVPTKKANMPLVPSPTAASELFHGLAPRTPTGISSRKATFSTSSE